ncbi:intradiol ring-cleavage dioxygenase [Candidatus Villigracilis affinis]|uniref:dioxygenase family protein n=1 Tax=Candidatus Villigracilis affinis TaxID=3140682 RepID=UPI0031EA3B3D
MKRLLILLIFMIAACAPLSVDVNPTLAPPLPDSTPTSIPAVQVDPATSAPAAEVTDESNIDILANLPDPDCSALTPADQEGPYYTPDTPERTSLIDEGMQGKKLILAGYVLTADCLPIPTAWLDFWQADVNGEYDNEGYTLRGHQFTDNKGRYYLETILPGEYPQRPIEHIHVKLQIPGGEVFTTQLYFPIQPVNGLTVQLEDKGDHFVAYFNFIMK